MRVLIGLGNPGAKYANTRHNAGFWVIERLAEQLGVTVRSARDHSHIGEASWSGHDLVLVKPQTFMNRSGEAAEALRRSYGVGPEEIMVIYDDLALEPGVIRLRAKGSAGGHNGIKSIIHYLGTEYFPRLRVGVGEVPGGVRGVEYVLCAPGPDELPLIDRAVDAAVLAALCWIEEGVEKAMSRYNGRWGNP